MYILSHKSTRNTIALVDDVKTAFTLKIAPNRIRLPNLIKLGRPLNFHFKRAFETLSHVQVKRNPTSKLESCNEKLPYSSFCNIFNEPYLHLSVIVRITIFQVDLLLASSSENNKSVGELVS